MSVKNDNMTRICFGKEGTLVEGICERNRLVCLVLFVKEGWRGFVIVKK